MGLKNSGQVFCRLIDHIMLEMKIGNEFTTYIDDVINHSKTFNQHIQSLRKLFQILRLNSLTLNAKKCKFGYTSIQFLGYDIKNGLIRPSSDKIDIIMKWPILKSIKQLRSFLGLINYYRKFINGFALIALPLTRLLKSKVKFRMTDEAASAFEEFKTILTTEPLLKLPDYSQEFQVFADASGEAVGGVLEQNGSPIAYFSKQLSIPQKNYTITEKEALALLLTLERFKSIVINSKIICYTDHSALIWLLNHTSPQGRIMRWIQRFAEFDIEVKYKPGRLNNNADSLSRIHECHVINDIWDDPESIHYMKTGIIDTHTDKKKKVAIKKKCSKLMYKDWMC